MSVNILLSSKHHEGFCLFKSKVDSYNSADGSAFKRDIIAELSEACYKHNMKFGLYYSQCLDWHEFHGGGYTTPFEHENVDVPRYWGNSWDFAENDKKDYNICFENKIKPQLKEFLTNYGDISLIWLDTPMEERKYEHSKVLYDMVREYHPGCLVNSRIGNGMCDYGSCGDNLLPDGKVEELIESPPHVGYKAFDNEWKDADGVCEILKKCNDRGANLLLNVGPDWLGRIPAPAIETFGKVGEKIIK